MVGQNSDDDLANELSKFVANEISPIAKPDLIQWSPVCLKRVQEK